MSLAGLALLDLSPMWLVVSVSYIAAAIWFRFRYRKYLSIWPSLAMFFIGAGLFLAINRRFIEAARIRWWLEIIILLLLTLAWVAALISIHEVVQLQQWIDENGHH